VKPAGKTRGQSRQGAIINFMEVGDIRSYVERWKAVAEIERQELRALTPEEHWRKLNALARFAMEMGLKREDDDGEMDVLMRWARIKERHETG